MEVKCLEACNGNGYENLEVGEVREISDSLAEILIRFGYVESTDENYSQGDDDDDQGGLKKYTESELKKLDKAAQEEIMISMELNPDDAKNEGERIEAIMNLQEGQE